MRPKGTALRKVLAIVSVLAMALAAAATPMIAQVKPDTAEFDKMLDTFKQAVSAYEQGELDKAAKQLEEVLKMNPGEYGALQMREAVGLAKLYEMFEQPETRETARKIMELSMQATLQRQADKATIEKHIAMLSGEKLQDQQLAMFELRCHGAYAVPFLLKYLDKDAKSEELRIRVRLVMTGMRPEAVPALVSALETQDQILKQAIILTLRGLKDQRALPALKAIIEREQNKDTVKFASEALAAIKGDQSELPAAAQLYAELAEKLLYRDRDAMEYTFEDTGDVWNWDESKPVLEEKLAASKVPDYLLHFALSQQACYRGLALEPMSKTLRELLVSQTLRQLGVVQRVAAGLGSVAPSWVEDAKKRLPLIEKQSRLLAQVNGIGILDMALQRAKRDEDAELAGAALDCIAEMVSEADGHLCPTLSEMLDFGDRRIRYKAATTIVSISPSGALGSRNEDVIKTLCAALDEQYAPTALIICDDLQSRNLLSAALRNLGVNTSDCGALTGRVEARLALTPSVNCVILSACMDKAAFSNVTAKIKSDARTKNAPVFLLLTGGKPCEGFDEAKAAAAGVINLPEMTRDGLKALVVDGCLARQEKPSESQEGSAAAIKMAQESLLKIHVRAAVEFEKAAGQEPVVASAETTATDAGQAAVESIAPVSQVEGCIPGLKVVSNYPVQMTIPALAKTLNGYPEDISLNSVKLLARYGCSDCASKMLKLLKEGRGSAQLRASAVMAAADIHARMGSCPSAEEMDALWGGVKGGEDEVKVACTLALGKLGLIPEQQSGANLMFRVSY
ncbi:MAG TPA: HEAT repeat domain-containing protein [Candidatus Brocadiia bacterium]|nr:HEAT repeat domain-containing protein [Candidatus Brocadiia bacterium]